MVNSSNRNCVRSRFGAGQSLFKIKKDSYIDDVHADVEEFDNDSEGELISMKRSKDMGN